MSTLDQGTDSAALASVSNETVQGFRRNGWVKLEGLLDQDDLTVLRRSVDDAIVNPPDLLSTYGVSKERLNDPVAQDDPEYSAVLRTFRDLRFRYPDLDRVVRQERVGAVIRDLLGVSHVRLFAESFLIKPAETQGSKPTPWHQDFPLIPFDRRDSVNVWIAVEDVPADAGALEFLSGSHRLGPLGRLDFKEDRDVWALLNNEDREVVGDVTMVPLAAGDAVAFQSLTLHHAGSNHAARERRGYQTFWIGSEVLYTGMPYFKTDNLGLVPGKTFDHERFPIVV